METRRGRPGDVSQTYPDIGDGSKTSNSLTRKNEYGQIELTRAEIIFFQHFKTI
ncbi:hypothetical protein HanPSC8_Chr05g0212701 [Helianthus annuus]|nr:hypothetical protein HanPSC8_Chr05g0212701 [Helianthus annuus]